MKYAVALLLSAWTLQAGAGASVPYTFGSSAPPANLNANFDYVEKVLNQLGNAGNIILRDASGENLAIAVCPNERKATNASCVCSSEDGTRNLGVLFGCSTIDNIGVAGCFDYLASSSKPGPLAMVTVQCAASSKIRAGTTSKELVTPLVDEVDEPSTEAARTVDALRGELEEHKRALLSVPVYR